MGLLQLFMNICNLEDRIKSYDEQIHLWQVERQQAIKELKNLRESLRKLVEVGPEERPQSQLKKKPKRPTPIERHEDLLFIAPSEYRM